MKTERTWMWPILLAVGLVALVIIGCVTTKEAVSYKTLAQNEGWDAEIDKAIAQWREEPSLESAITIISDPEAFETIYALGPEAAPYILDRVLESEDQGGTAAFLVAAAKENLHHRADLLDDDGTNPYSMGTPKYYAYNLRAFLKEVPGAVNDICNSDATEAEKLEQLSELGLAALPYVTNRIQRGETQWTPYLETQLLGLTVDERFEALKNEVTLARTGEIDSVYAYRQEVARPVDVTQWIAANKDTLSVLEEVTG